MNFVPHKLQEQVTALPLAPRGSPAPTGRARFPLTSPRAPRLSAATADLRAIEDSCILSNYGPVNDRFERTAADRLFGGLGRCLTTSSATMGLMLALKDAAWRRPDGARHVVMPAFTFAAAAQAVLWAGLVPVLVDADPDDWTAAVEAEAEALARFAGRVAAVMPYAAFGKAIDLDRYDALADRHGVAIVVDAASSIGSLDHRHLNFGAGSRHAVVFSLHATKAFGVGEGGLVHSADADLVARLRRMGNFGMGPDRTATMPGLNGKMSEVAALAASVKLPGLDDLADHRARLAIAYRRGLPGWSAQAGDEPRRAYQFMPLLLAAAVAPHRAALQARMQEAGVGTGHYFSPHLGQQPYLRDHCRVGPLPTTDRLAARMLSLPMHDLLTVADVGEICDIAREACDALLDGDPA